MIDQWISRSVIHKRLAPEPFLVLSMLWIVLHLIHVHSNFEWGTSVFHAALIIVGLVYLFFPRTKTFVCALLLGVAVIYWDLPNADNHWLFVGYINITMLLGFLYVRLRHPAKLSVSYVLHLLAPVLCLYTVLPYIISVFHKFNADFFDPSVSCVLHIHQRFSVSEILPILSTPPYVQQGVIVGVWLMLVAVPLLFAFRRTWFFAMLIGAVFHLLTAAYIWVFPVTMLTLYMLFLPSRVREVLLKSIDKKIGLVSSIAVCTFFLSMFLIAQIYVYTYFDVPLDALKLADARIWGIANVLLLVGFVLFIVRTRLAFVPREPLRSKVPVWMWIVPLLFLAQCFSPYVGLKTTTSQSMYSNLRTEGEGSNHLLVPHTLPQVARYQEDTVRLIASSNPVLQEMADLDLHLPWIGLKQEVFRKPSLPLQFERNGIVYDVQSSEDYPELFTPLSFIERKLLSFRPFSAPEKAMVCMW